MAGKKRILNVPISKGIGTIKVPGACQLAKCGDFYNIRSPLNKVVYTNYPLV